MKAVVILGAGFSKNSGLPLQSEIPSKLISSESVNEMDRASASILRNFCQNVFHYEKSKYIPNLDDLFTCIDISTNSGHHLGPHYSPQHLRAVRRLLVYQVFSILEGSFQYNPMVDEVLHQIQEQYEVVNYVVLNWDTVLEKYLGPGWDFNYHTGGGDWFLPKGYAERQRVDLFKVHGSMNWLYCDCCRSLYHDINNNIALIHRAGLQWNDFDLFEDLKAIPCKEEYVDRIRCPHCDNPISSHIATFSYRKSFRVNSFANIWRGAEEALATAEQWIFIGYSLPDADYEFKHLLKIAELKQRHKLAKDLKVEVVLSEEGTAADKYRCFFGSRLHRIYTGGLKEYLEKN